MNISTYCEQQGKLVQLSSLIKLLGITAAAKNQLKTMFSRHGN